MARDYNIWLFAFFTALLFIKVSAIHVYSHAEDGHDQIETCEHCEFAIENQNNQLLLPLSLNLDISNFEFFLDKPNYNSYISPILRGVLAKEYGRPPPGMV